MAWTNNTSCWCDGRNYRLLFIVLLCTAMQCVGATRPPVPTSWQFDYSQYDNYMSITALVSTGSSASTHVDSGTLIAYVDKNGQSEVRGINSSPQQIPFGPYQGSWSYGIMIYADNDTPELHFAYRDDTGVTRELVDDSGTIHMFTTNGIVGSSTSPVIFVDAAVSTTSSTTSTTTLSMSTSTTTASVSGPRYSDCDTNQNSDHSDVDLPEGACCTVGGQCASAMCNLNSYTCDSGGSSSSTTSSTTAAVATSSTTTAVATTSTSVAPGDQTGNAPSQVQYVNSKTGEVIGPATDANFGFWYNANLKPKSITVMIQI